MSCNPDIIPEILRHFIFYDLPIKFGIRKYRKVYSTELICVG